MMSGALNARFGGIPRQVSVPLAAVLAITP